MKLAPATETVITNSNKKATGVGMTIDNASLGHIMTILTDIYPNPVLATIREYSANAYDSHIAAKQTRPIEVTLPSAFNPVFTVTDYGVGMGEHELLNIYSVYGASTKRESNEEIGAFGLGSKSALNLVPSFNLITRKDGKEYRVLIQLDKEGVGQLEIRSTKPTTEPNGVTVSIPAKNVSEFQHYAEQLFFTWDPKTVLVNGKPPRTIHDSEYEKVEDFGYISSVRNYQKSGITVVMGGIPYRLNRLSYDNQRKVYGTFYNTYGSQDIVLNAPLGAIDLVASREDVKLSPRSLEFIANQTQNLITAFRNNIAKQVAEAPTRIEALKTIDKFPFVYDRSDYRWGGEEIPVSVPTRLTSYTYNTSTGRKNKWSNSNAQFEVRTISKNTPHLIVDTTGSTVETSTVMRHVSSWAKSENLTLKNLFVGELGKEVNVWIKALADAKMVIIETADEVARKAKQYNKDHRSQRAASGPRDTLTYPVAYFDSTRTACLMNLTASDLKNAGVELYHIEAQKDGYGAAGSIEDSYSATATRKELLEYIPAGAYLVIIGSNRKVNAYLTRLGDVESTDVLSLVKESVEKDLNVKTPLISLLATRMANDSVLRRHLRKFKGQKISSELFTELVNRLDQDVVEVPVSIKATATARRLLGWNEETCNARRTNVATDSESTVAQDFINRYPLLRLAIYGASHGAFDEKVITPLVAYINSVDAKEPAFKA